MCGDDGAARVSQGKAPPEISQLGRGVGRAFLQIGPQLRVLLAQVAHHGRHFGDEVEHLHLVGLCHRRGMKGRGDDDGVASGGWSRRLWWLRGGGTLGRGRRGRHGCGGPSGCRLVSGLARNAARGRFSRHAMATGLSRGGRSRLSPRSCRGPPFF